MSEHHEAEIALIAFVLGGAVVTLALMIGFRIMCMAF